MIDERRTSTYGIPRQQTNNCSEQPIPGVNHRMNNNQQGRNQDAYDNTIWQDADTGRMPDGRMLVDCQFNWMDGNTRLDKPETRLDNQTHQMPQQ